MAPAILRGDKLPKQCRSMNTAIVVCWQSRVDNAKGQQEHQTGSSNLRSSIYSSCAAPIIYRCNTKAEIE